MIRLALDAGRVLTVETQALWPDDRPRDPAHALQSLMSRLRAALPEEATVRSSYGGYCLDLPPEAVDVLRFERLVNEGRRALRNGEVQDAARRLREALGLWRGEPLAEVADAPYAIAVAVRLRELQVGFAQRPDEPGAVQVRSRPGDSHRRGARPAPARTQ